MLNKELSNAVVALAIAVKVNLVLDITVAVFA